MSVVPEYLFPSMPTVMKGKSERMRISMAEFIQPEVGQAYDYNIGVMDIIDIDVTELGLNDLDQVVWTYPNDVNVHLWISADLTGYRMYTEYNGSEIIIDGSWSTGVQPLPSSIYRTAFYNHSKAKLLLVAKYMDPIANVTPCYALSWFLMIPALRVLDEYGTTVYNKLLDFYTGMSTFIRVGINMIEYSGAEFEVPTNVTFQPVSLASPLDFTDLETFSDAMQTAGSGMDEDVFTDDPQTPDEDTSDTGGGGGNYDNTSDPIDVPELPTGGALTSGMLKGFVIGQAGLINMQQKLWDMSIFDVSTQFQKLVNQPLDCLISLHCLPCTPVTGSSDTVKLGSFDTEVSALLITNQYLEINCGSLTISEYWGSALDYAPYTNVEIFLPFIGIRNLKIEDVQKSTVSVIYHVDVLTGDCVAYVKCGKSVLYSYTGNCLSHIPCTSQSSDLLAKGIAAVGSVGIGMATGNPASTAGGVISGITNVATAKNHIQRSGEVAGSPGIMSEFIPYLIIHRPVQSLASGYNTFKGYPSNITYELGSLSGYTEVEHIHLTGITGATDTELNEIEQLLKSGVII